MAPLSVSTEAGQPRAAPAADKVATTSKALVLANAVEATKNREWSSITFRTSTSLPSARAQWVVSACQHSLGSSAAKRTNEHRGRFWGWGVIKPRRFSTLQIEDTDGTSVFR